jgi:hypothetical protein
MLLVKAGSLYYSNSNALRFLACFHGFQWKNMMVVDDIRVDVTATYDLLMDVAVDKMETYVLL